MNTSSRHNPSRVRLVQGPLIPGGDSRSSEDLTLLNSRLAVTFALGTNPPWGLIKGGLLDAAAVKNNEPEPDLLAIFDFLPDNWGGWPNSYLRTEVLASGPEKGVIQVERDWGALELVTTYTLENDQDHLQVLTRMTNSGLKKTAPLASGYAFWPKRGYILSPPGMNGVRQGAADQAFADWFVAYDLDWSLALHAPFADFIDHYGRGMFSRQTLSPGETRTFSGWLQFGDSGDINPVLKQECRRKGQATGRLSGYALDEKGHPLEQPIIIAEKNHQTFTWTLGSQGSYSLLLPPGEYQVQATGPGYGSSQKIAVTISGPGEQIQDFSGLTSPARLNFQVQDRQSGLPLQAKIDIDQGQKPTVGFLGHSTFFTDLDRVGRACCSLAPGTYTFKVTRGQGFLSLPEYVTCSLQPGQEETIQVHLSRITPPKDRGWYGVDLHHHSDVLDGSSPPEEVARSQLAAGLDILFLSDHDSTANNQQLAELAAARDLLFLPGMEISRSWGHFNIYPLGRVPEEQSGPVLGDARKIFAISRAMGAEVIAVNHPYSTYGYFRNLEQGLTPGDFAPDFDLLEINYQHPVQPVVEKAWDFWNQGCGCYLSAGTDSHDVQVDVSGSVRVYVHLPGKPSLGGLLAALKAGRSYASFGPLVFPEIMFGSCLQVAADHPLDLSFEVQAVNGLSRVDLIEQGELLDRLQCKEKEQQKTVAFQPRPAQDTWYALVVADRFGNRAYTNPIWVRV